MSVTSFASIFSHSVGFLFVLFMVSFAVQKLLSLIRSHLFIFVFTFITLGGGSKKDLAMIYVGGGGINWEIGIDTYTLLYIE